MQMRPRRRAGFIEGSYLVVVNVPRVEIEIRVMIMNSFHDVLIVVVLVGFCCCFCVGRGRRNLRRHSLYRAYILVIMTDEKKRITLNYPTVVRIRLR